MRYKYSIFLALAVLALQPSAQAATSPWTDTPGGRVRVIIEDGIAQGELRGVLQVDLQAGWKTYWRNPGDSGVPPQVSVADGVKAKIDFPAPEYFGADQKGGIGYSRPVSLPLTFQLAQPKNQLKGNAFLGVCDKICIPVLVDFDLPLTSEAQIASSQKTPQINPQAIAEKTVIDAAFQQLPRAATPEFGVKSFERDADRIIVEVALPDQSAQGELFLSSEQFSLSVAEPVEGEPQKFMAKIYGKTDQEAEIDYTLVQNGQAVSGTLTFK